MILRKYPDNSPEAVRDKALRAAIVLRDCSLRPQTSSSTRRACRTVMREHATVWRHPPPAGAGDGA